MINWFFRRGGGFKADPRIPPLFLFSQGLVQPHTTPPPFLTPVPPAHNKPLSFFFTSPRRVSPKCSSSTGKTWGKPKTWKKQKKKKNQRFRFAIFGPSPSPSHSSTALIACRPSRVVVSLLSAALLASSVFSPCFELVFMYNDENFIEGK